MSNWAKRWMAGVLAVVLAFGSIGLYDGFGGMKAEASAMPVLQLVADQDLVSPGAEIGYHVLYVNTTNKVQTEVTVDITVSPGLEAADIQQALWNPSLGRLQFRVLNIAQDDVVHLYFTLKAKADVKKGDVLEASAVVRAGATLVAELPKVRVKAGTRVDQPFMQGYPDGNFKPDRSITRAEMAAVVSRIRQLQPPGSVTPYEDVAPAHWAYDYIQRVKEAGYMVGHQGNFRPDAPITKAELVTLVLRLRGIHHVPLSKSKFADMDLHWAKLGVETAKLVGILEEETGEFGPDHTARRDWAAKRISIGLHRGPLMDGEAVVEQHYPDVSRSHTYFHWIAEVSKLAHEAVVRGNGREYLIRYLPEETNPF